MSLQIEENIGKILKNQGSKRIIESKLITKRVKKGDSIINNNRIELGFMIFQVMKQGYLSDHMNLFPCLFELKGKDSRGIIIQRKQKEAPKVGSFIRALKMDFDLKTFNLIIYDYQYLGGANSIVPSLGYKVNWNNQTISQIIRRNNTEKGGEVLLDSYQNDKISQTEILKYPNVRFLSVKLSQQILAESAAQPQPLLAHTVQKITAPKLDIDNEEKQELHFRDSNKNQHNINSDIQDLQL